jgi:protoporphyrinogen oxidase
VDISRRSFIRWVLGAGAAMACPFPLKALGKEGGAPSPQLGSEAFSVCHSVRDGESMPVPSPDKKVGVVIIGGGPAGLAAADELKSADWLLLEKEPQVGGNCRPEEWEGLKYSTAAAWDSIADADFKRLSERWKFDWKKIEGHDTVIYDGKLIRDFWNGRADDPAFEQLPYSKTVKEGFRQFLRDIEGIDLAANLQSLDNQTFASVLEGYPSQLKAFFDAFGPSNYGAVTEDASAYVGLGVARDWFRTDRYTWEGGIGPATQKVLDSIGKTDRILTGCTAYKVRRKGKTVWVSFFQDGKPRTVEARSVVVAAPKFIARHLVEDLPEDQHAAMGEIRYAPFLVYNLCFDRPVWDQGYDTYPIGAKHFADIIPADWVTHAGKGPKERKQVLTVYAPKPTSERVNVLDDAKCLKMAQDAAEEVCALSPGAIDSLREVRIARRGHPMPMSIPGMVSRIQPLSKRPLAPVYFGHSDSQGEISDFFYGALGGIAAAQDAAKHL